MAHQLQSRPEPMNATPHHSKVRLSVTLSDKFYIAGDAITGKMELESRADTGLGLGIIAVELIAIEGPPPPSPLSSSQLIFLSPSTPRANIQRPFRHLDFHTHPSFLPRPRSSPLERRDCPPNRRRATPTRPLPPGPTRPHHIPLPHPSSALLAPINRLWQRARTNTIRGQRLCGRCVEEPEQARDEPVSRRRTPAIPWRRQHGTR